MSNDLIEAEIQYCIDVLMMKPNTDYKVCGKLGTQTCKAICNEVTKWLS